MEEINLIVGIYQKEITSNSKIKWVAVSSCCRIVIVIGDSNRWATWTCIEVSVASRSRTVSVERLSGSSCAWLSCKRLLSGSRSIKGLITDGWVVIVVKVWAMVVHLSLFVFNPWTIHAYSRHFCSQNSIIMISSDSVLINHLFLVLTEVESRCIILDLRGCELILLPRRWYRRLLSLEPDLNISHDLSHRLLLC